MQKTYRSIFISDVHLGTRDCQANKLNNFLKLQAGVENIFDLNYRYFASGFSAPGRTFILSLRIYGKDPAPDAL